MARGHPQDLNPVLHEWEHWSAERLKSPLLPGAVTRSQHDNQSWLGSMTTILDTCALVMVGVGDTPTWQARLTFRWRDTPWLIAQVFRAAQQASPELCRLAPGELDRIWEILAKNNTHFAMEQAEAKLMELRSMYEFYVCALSELLLMPLPPDWEVMR